MEDLRTAGERLSKYELEKRHAIQLEDYERAKLKKAQMDEYRHTVYRFLEVDDLLEISGVRTNQSFKSLPTDCMATVQLPTMVGTFLFNTTSRLPLGTIWYYNQ
jgi:hypothetical protein